MSKGRYVATQSLAERIYWQRTLPRKQRNADWWPNRPTVEQQRETTDQAWRRAQAIATRYQRMKKRRSSPQPRAERDRMDEVT